MTDFAAIAAQLTAIDDARIVEVCDAAVAQIDAAAEAGAFAPLRFEACRSYATWDEELKIADKIQIDVVPSRYERSDLLSRTRRGYQTSIEIYIRQKFGPNSLAADNQIPQATIDALVRLTEQIDQLFAILKRPPADETISWTDGRILTACSRPTLRQRQTFFSAQKITFDAPRILTPA